MKKLGVVMFVLPFLITTLEIEAQNLQPQNAQIELGVRCVQPNKGLSYYFDNVGNRMSVGEYSPVNGLEGDQSQFGEKCFWTSLYF